MRTTVPVGLPHADRNNGKQNKTARTIDRRQPRPNARAVTGGLLIAVAAVGTFASYHRGGPHQRYVVAVRRLNPGDLLDASDVELVDANLPPSMRGSVFTSIPTLVGASVETPIPAGGLIQTTEVAPSAPRGALEVSVSLDRGRAVGGTLRPGEFVDVLGTFGTGSSSYTAVMAAHVQVLEVSGAADALQVIVLAVPDATAAEAVADASAAVALTLVRTAPSEAGPPAPYSPPAGP
jgi:Flp pilus assembly protein CpaB